MNECFSNRHLLIVLASILLAEFLPFCALAADKPTESNEARRLAAIIAEPKTPFDRKWDAAAALRLCPPAQVYAALFDHLGPSPDANSAAKENVGWDASNHDALAKAPSEWQSCLLIEKVWNDMAPIAKDGRGAIVAELLPKATNDTQRFEILTELYWNWTANAEEPVVKLMRDHRDPDVQFVAANALMKNVKAKYYSEMRDTYLGDKKLPLLERMKWLEILAWHYPNEKLPESDYDMTLLQLGFGLLDEGPATIPRWQGDTSTYIAARRLGYYLSFDGEFAPLIKDPKYHDGTGNLRPEFFLDTVRNAKKWWADNENRLERKQWKDK